MQIRDIKAFPTWVGSRNQLIVKVETDNGLVGWGEACQWPVEKGLTRIFGEAGLPGWEAAA
jgi:L-alanine-DL-glutamate epimerase-like enolase superfamily enzyme